MEFIEITVKLETGLGENTAYDSNLHRAYY